MKNTEIRIGNLIKRNGLVVTVDEQIFWDMKNKPEEFEPIPLTENWFYKIGKKEQAEFPSYRIGGMLINFVQGKWTEYVHRIHLKSVHQLQNLYFALYGEELQM
ncbi:hypothetical protein [Bergeyella zoohelcum]|uniref:hypothetical protein n=1 Tax=Bergeyella zoohelcum TaxID=1015 RepID=UPI0037364BF3